jgi:uncharacterized protein YecE (DUF72 family)
MAEMLVGTSGWSYPRGEGTWKGHFYPPGTRDELAYYSGIFNTVEVNSSFYRPPEPATTAAWARETPAGFLFAVKLWQKFTHPRMYEEATGQSSAISAGDVDLFRSSLEPLIAQGKLGALLAQFPPGFVSNSHNRRTLRAVMQAFGDCRLAVELRHRSWSDHPGTAELLAGQKVAWVRIDEPKFDFSISAETPLTSNLVYFRFHGRNAAAWWRGNAETRYQYLYSTEEISELAESIKAASRQAARTMVYFNNHWRAYAPRNAGQLIRQLGLPFNGIPSLGLIE